MKNETLNNRRVQKARLLSSQQRNIDNEFLDYDTLYDYRIYSQYREGVIIKEWMSILPFLAQTELRDALLNITYNLDDASGDQLNFIGRVVGLERAYISEALLQEFFGYEDTPNAVGYGVASYINDDDSALLPLPDYLYRAAIRAKIVQNSSTSTLDEVALLAEFMTQEPVTVIDNEDMTFSIDTQSGDISDELTLVLQFYNLEIKPAGVQFLGYNFQP